MQVNNRIERVNIITLGCSKNLYDTETLSAKIKNSGIHVVHEDQIDDTQDTVVINTCGFIEASKQESINTILDYVDRKSRGLVKAVYVTGCLSERYKDDLELQIPEVDRYFKITDLQNLLEILDVDYQKDMVGERQLLTPAHYAYLKISEGCDRTCSFCSIPGIRGKHISRTLESLEEEAQTLAASGVKELILIAQDLTYYGVDIYRRRALADLLKLLVKVEGIEWIRLHYAHPASFPKEILSLMAAEPKICNYLDIPLQHIANPVLKSMKRSITKEKTNELIETIRQTVPNVHLRTTLIVGYPNETESDYRELLDWVEAVQFDRLGCFSYSHEEGTSAYALKDRLSQKDKQNRVDQLMKKQSEISYLLNKQKIGKVFRCIVDARQGEHWIGRTEYDSPDVDNEVIIQSDRPLEVGEFYQVQIKDISRYELFGSLI